MYTRSKTFRLVPCILVTFCVLACTTAERRKQDAFDAGERYFRQQRYADAVVAYQSAIKLDPRFGNARLKLAKALLQQGNRAAALAEAVRAADLLPRSSDAQIEAANQLLSAGSYEDAKARAQKALDLDSNSVDALLVIGNSLAALQDLDSAIRQVQQASALGPKRETALASLAGLQAAKGNLELARTTFQRAVEANPKSVKPWLALANFQFQTGDSAGLETSLTRAVAIDGRDESAVRALATFYASTGRPSKAEPLLKTLTEISGKSEARFELIDYYIAERRYAEARSILKSMEQDRNTRSQAQLRSADVEYLDGHREAATKILDGLLAADPSDVNALVMKARWLLEAGRGAEALKLASNAVQANNQSVEAYYILGAVQAQTRDLAGAISSFNEVLRLNPRVTAAQVQLARLQLAAGNAGTASELAQGALKAEPDDRDVRLLLARSLLAQGDSEGADREFAPLRRQYPNAALTHAFNGLVLAAKNDRVRARAEYDRALQADPGHLVALSGLMQLLAAQGNLKEARRLIDAQLAPTPRAGVQVLAARVHAQDGDLAGAERLLRQAIERDANNLDAYGVLGQLYLQQRRLDEARLEFEARVKANPKDIGALVMVGQILEMQQKPAEAKKIYTQVISADPKASSAANNLAWIMAEEGSSLDEALRLAQLAVEGLPERAEVHDTLGWVYYKKDMIPLATRAFERSIELDSSNPSYYYRLALAQAKGKDVARARKSLESALKLNPKMEEASKLLASLGR